MSVPEVPASNKRLRRTGQHRGWTAAQMTPTRIATDIVRSIQLHEANGNCEYTPAQYTDDTTIIALATALLSAVTQGTLRLPE